MRNPGNRYDPNACEVWWRNAYLLGHLPRSLARDVAPLMDAGRPLRAYVYRPGSGAAWSMSALLLGGAVEPWHAVRVRRQVERAFADMERAERRQAHVGRDNAIRFDSRLEKCRAARLQAAVNTFIRLPFEARLPAVDSTVEVDVIASALDLSRTTVFRMARKAGVEPEISKRGWYSVSATVTVTAALHDALRDWCAAPRGWVTRYEIDAVIRNAEDSHKTAPVASAWDDEDDEIPF